jgi:hypothetical protein
MQSKKAIMTSRREFVSNALGVALVTALTWQARADQAHSIHEQSDSRNSNSGSTTQNRSLRWDVFAISSALPSRRPPRWNYMTKCSSCTLTGSIEVRSGVQCVP